MKANEELDLSALEALLEKATPGPWRIDRGLMADALRITARSREGFLNRDDGDGPICRVSTERLHFSKEEGFGRDTTSRTWKTPIHKAPHDAELIVAAVNSLPELIRRAKLNIDETAWLIEWPADKFGPIRYWAIGEHLPVVNASDATRLARKADAEAVIRSQGLKGSTPADHMWLKPKKRARDSGSRSTEPRPAGARAAGRQSGDSVAGASPIPSLGLPTTPSNTEKN